MKVRNTLDHKAGTSILVNGTRYQIGKDGIVQDVSEEDAAKLGVDQPGRPWRSVKDRTPAPEAPPPPPPPMESELAEEELAEEELEEEWPEPEEDMDIEYLREMAEAYEVNWTSRMKASTLVKRIKEAQEG
jgi:hypothetical protein